MSENQNTWNSTSYAGVIIGFGVFALMYMFTVVSIFIDIKKRGADY